MTDFIITAPDGKKYKVSGESQEGAVAALKKMLSVQPVDDVVATTKDGGRVIKKPDGSLSFTSPAFATTDQAQIAKIMEGATPAQVSTSGFDQATVAQNPIAARASKFVQGVPFVGEFADEVVGAVSPVAGQAMRATQGAMQREYPVQSAALQVAGGIAGAVPMAIAAAPAVVAAAPTGLAAQEIGRAHV